MGKYGDHYSEECRERKTPVPTDGSELTCDEAGVERCEFYPDCPCSPSPQSGESNG